MNPQIRAMIILAALFVIAIIGVLTSAKDQPERIITIGFLSSPEDEDYKGAAAFKAVVERETAGRVRVDIFPSGQFCGNERECLDGLGSGLLDIHMTTVGGIGRLFGAAQVLDLPYLLPNDAVAHCVLDGPMLDQLRRAALERDLGLRLMVISDTGGWRHLATANKAIHKPQDLAGLKIRSTPSAMQQELLRLFGANPTPIAWGEVYTALATGVVEGTKNSVQDIVGAKLHEALDYLTLDGHAYMAAMWWYSEKQWAMLPDQDRAAVEKGFAALKTITRRLPKEGEQHALEAFKAAGGTVITLDAEEKAAFVKAAQPLRAWYKDRYGTEWLDLLTTEIARCEALSGSSRGHAIR
ncbi:MULTISPECIES: TRAP transporter substrate-binding protein DctP [unclassified Iodidimonas]|jgi:tripartite ATP-independent transporter DctP family solute receptor|uniref:TRAP transporter substrate-binding protein DctP n=1 Tax=unclassified Iodidimonas TaxID=2626145 RepID=UPI0024828231|nr:MULTISPECIES: TRAP transporter substrate-binding protein DctP [unclassified Iodidimonas]